MYFTGIFLYICSVIILKSFQVMILDIISVSGSFIANAYNKQPG